jgi:DNA primase
VYSSGVKNVIANSGTAITDRQISLIWKFFSNPIVCLDGDESGQKAALRIAEKLFPFINEKNKIYFSIMPKGKDPDDFVKQNGKSGLLKLLEGKEIIQTYIWNYHLNKIDLKSPYDVSKFEKEIKNLAYSIQDETLKKYVLEDFLEKLGNLTPLQSFKKNNKFFKKKDYKILKETKLLYQKKQNFSKLEIIEFSILFIILNHPNIASNKIEELSQFDFFSEKNNDLKNEIIKFLTTENDINSLKSNINKNYNDLLKEIQDLSNIQMILKGKNTVQITEFLDELIIDFKEQNNLKKIESLEKKLINNLDESSYSELIELKSQLNRD